MNKYNFNFAISADITVDTIKNMIKQIVEDQTGRKVKTVEFKTRTTTQGYGQAEYDSTEFDGAHITFETESQ